VVLAQAAVQVLAVPLAAQVQVPVVQQQVLVQQVPPPLVLPLQRLQPWVWWLLAWLLLRWSLPLWPRRPTPSTQPLQPCLEL
jgi:hypothetical protein